MFTMHFTCVVGHPRVHPYVVVHKLLLFVHYNQFDAFVFNLVIIMSGVPCPNDSFTCFSFVTRTHTNSDSPRAFQSFVPETPKLAVHKPVSTARQKICHRSGDGIFPPPLVLPDLLNGTRMNASHEASDSSSGSSDHRQEPVQGVGCISTDMEEDGLDSDDVNIYVSPRRFVGRTPGPKATKQRIFEEERAAQYAELRDNEQKPGGHHRGISLGVENVKYTFSKNQNCKRNLLPAYPAVFLLLLAKYF